uniref:Uncharacterized protein n=1 Tax=Caenorhabditis japonica TaxID=281687 RepID=A0A8R1HJU5_CAEJA
MLRSRRKPAEHRSIVTVVQVRPQTPPTTLPIFPDVFDVRIHEGAEKGSRLTMSQELQKSTEPLGHCFGQLETDVEWIEWRSSRSAFYTSSRMPISATKNSNNLVGTLHL